MLEEQLVLEVTASTVLRVVRLLINHRHAVTVAVFLEHRNNEERLSFDIETLFADKVLSVFILFSLSSLVSLTISLLLNLLILRLNLLLRLMFLHLIVTLLSRLFLLLVRVDSDLTRPVVYHDWAVSLRSRAVRMVLIWLLLMFSLLLIGLFGLTLSLIDLIVVVRLLVLVDMSIIALVQAVVLVSLDSPVVVQHLNVAWLLHPLPLIFLLEQRLLMALILVQVFAIQGFVVDVLAEALVVASGHDVGVSVNVVTYFDI